METKLVALKLLLEEMGTGTDVSSKERRLVVQKSVYLMQAAGLKLGYSFNWDLHGPYASDLTRDYYELQAESGSFQAADVRLSDAVVRRVAEIQGILEVPDEVDLTAPQWVELLASIHFLRCELKQDAAKAREIVGTQKAPLMSAYDTAEECLRRYGLLDE